MRWIICKDADSFTADSDKTFDITIGDKELLSVHATQVYNASNRKKKKPCIQWFITYRTSIQQTLYLRYLRYSCFHNTSCVNPYQTWVLASSRWMEVQRTWTSHNQMIMKRKGVCTLPFTMKKKYTRETRARKLTCNVWPPRSQIANHCNWPLSVCLSFKIATLLPSNI